MTHKKGYLFHGRASIVVHRRACVIAVSVQNALEPPRGPFSGRSSRMTADYRLNIQINWLYSALLEWL